MDIIIIIISIIILFIYIILIIPPPLRRVYSPATFKCQLKTFLYNHAFNSHC